MEYNYVYVTYKYADINIKNIKDIKNIIDIILDYGIIAGGFALSLISKEYKTRDIDVFILNNNNNVMRELIEKLSHELNNIKLRYYGSVVEITSDGFMPIQIILTDHKNPEDVTTAFDMDYVQCGIKRNPQGNIILFRSDIAELAHENKYI